MCWLSNQGIAGNKASVLSPEAMTRPTTSAAKPAEPRPVTQRQKQEPRLTVDIELPSACYRYLYRTRSIYRTGTGSGYSITPDPAVPF